MLKIIINTLENFKPTSTWRGKTTILPAESATTTSVTTTATSRNTATQTTRDSAVAREISSIKSDLNSASILIDPDSNSKTILGKSSNSHISSPAEAIKEDEEVSVSIPR